MVPKETNQTWSHVRLILRKGRREIRKACAELNLNSTLAWVQRQYRTSMRAFIRGPGEGGDTVLREMAANSPELTIENKDGEINLAFKQSFLQSDGTIRKLS